MRSDLDIHNDIGSILAAIAPEGACQVIMRAKLSSELDTCQYEYDAVYEQGNTTWFTAGGRANTDMLALLVELRRWYIKNKLTAGHTAWDSCEVRLDLAKVKINFTFTYPE